MKAKPCTLLVWNRCGYCVFHNAMPSVAAAKREARWLIDNGYAFSYKIYKRPHG